MEITKSDHTGIRRSFAQNSPTRRSRWLVLMIRRKDLDHRWVAALSARRSVEAILGAVTMVSRVGETCTNHCSSISGQMVKIDMVRRLEHTLNRTDAEQGSPRKRRSRSRSSTNTKPKISRRDLTGFPRVIGSNVRPTGRMPPIASNASTRLKHKRANTSRSTDSECHLITDPNESHEIPSYRKNNANEQGQPNAHPDPHQARGTREPCEGSAAAKRKPQSRRHSQHSATTGTPYTATRVGEASNPRPTAP